MQLNVLDVSQWLQVPENLVYRWVREGNLPTRNVDGQLWFNKTEVYEWLILNPVKVSPAVFRETAGLSGALESGGVLEDLRGHDRDSVLRAVVQRLRLPADFDREILLQLLLSRERLGSTAIGDGIAIPHPRYPVLMPGERPTATLCYLPEPIEFGAADGRPVQILFVLTSPTMRSHSLFLAQLACALRNDRFRGAVLARRSFQHVLDEARHWDDLCHQGGGRPPAEQVA